MSNQCKWIVFGVISAIFLLVLCVFYRLENMSKCPVKEQLRYKEDSKCYERLSPGPCVNGLVFDEDDPESFVGSCNCPYMRTNRTFVYHNGQCYHIFSQAYCHDGHWLNVTTKGVPICEPNFCISFAKNSLYRSEYQNPKKEWVPIKGGRCAILGEYAAGCPAGSVVRFHSNYILPSCFDPPVKKFGISSSAIGVGAYIKCPMGSAKAITGFCQPIFDFDFD